MTGFVVCAELCRVYMRCRYCCHICVEGVESVECGPVRPLAAVLVEPLVRGKVKDDDAWSKHSRVVCYVINF